MSASRLPLKSLTAVITVALSIGAWRSKPIILRFLTGPGSYSRLVALAVILANYKNFPGVWHSRVWHGILSHMYAPPHTSDFTVSHLPTLFQPSITPGRSPAAECDYNLHKSNSTYFSDLDVTRSHLVCALMNTAIRKLHKNPGLIIAPDGRPARGRWGIMLGGVYCGFRREIKPYEAYEMWSRVLCWDRKWLYVVTHFVRRGAVKPDGWTLEDPAEWKFVPRIFRRGKRKARTPGSGPGQKPAQEIPADAIFASAISKYVMKVGRLTVHPEAVLDMSGLLPPKPGGWNTMDGTKAEVEEEAEGLEEMEESVLTLIGIPNGKDNTQANGNANGTANGTANGKINGMANGTANGIPVVAPSPAWDWKAIEAENARGMAYATHHASLEGLSETFTGSAQPALGYYTDIL